MARVLLAVLLLAGLGCSRLAAPVDAPPVEGAKPLSEAEQKAVDLARKMLDRQGVPWGRHEAIQLTPDGKHYWITYPTPASEQKTLGPRAVTVEVTTGEAKLVMRD